MFNLGAPELLIIIVVLGLPFLLVVLAVVLVKVMSSKRGSPELQGEWPPAEWPDPPPPSPPSP